MKTLIIGDIHHRVHVADKIIADNPEVDQIVFVGDYFDNFGDGRSQSRQTAEWLGDSIYKPNRIHLWGNHDIQYCNSNTFRCGWTSDKHEIINYTLSKYGNVWNKLQLFVVVDGFLISHAGINPMFIPEALYSDNELLYVNDTFEWLQRECNYALKRIGNIKPIIGRLAFYQMSDNEQEAQASHRILGVRS